MGQKQRLCWCLVLVALLSGVACGARRTYPWLQGYQPKQAIVARIPPPRGFHLETAARGSFADWLQRLPLKPGRPPVRLFDGSRKLNQAAHYAVIDMDTLVPADLQQCADGVMRLRAEYLYSRSRDREIHFNYTSGDRIAFTRWAQGSRPVVNGNKVTWRTSGGRENSYANFRSYLANVFQYAGTLSLSQELDPVADLRSLRTGDVFIRGGTPGHVVIVVATAVDGRGRKVFLLAQGYTPAQELHVLRNPANDDTNPWYSLPASNEIVLATPEYMFRWNEARRFPKD